MKNKLKKILVFIESLELGTPPHGDLIWFDRMIMLLTGSKTIRDVMPFLKHKMLVVLWQAF